MRRTDGAISLDAARAATLALLDQRAPGATICPSEVARMLATDWRRAMPDVHAAIDAMAAEGMVRLSWKGRTLAARAGAYRIGRGGLQPTGKPRSD